MDRRDFKRVAKGEFGDNATVLDVDSPLADELFDKRLGELWAVGAEMLGASHANQTDANLWSMREAVSVFERAGEYADGDALLAYSLAAMVALNLASTFFAALMQAENVVRMREELGD